MFSKKKIKSSKIDTLIGRGVEVNGDICFQGGLHLDGKIIGNVSSSASDNTTSAVLVVSDKGRIEGDVHVAYAIINGEVAGNVYASEKLELSARARVSGNVHYNLLEMASGAEINGKMHHETSVSKRLEHKKADEPETAETDSNVRHLDETVVVQ